MTSITGAGLPASMIASRWIFLRLEEMFRDAAMVFRYRSGPNGHARPDRGPGPGAGTLGGYLGDGPGAGPAARLPVRPQGPHGAGRRRAHRTSQYTAGDRGARFQQSNGPHDRADQHCRKAPARPPDQRVRQYAGGGGSSAPGHPRERLGHRSGLGSQAQLQRQTGMHAGTRRRVDQRSGGPERAAGHRARREPLLPRRDRAPHHARHGAARHLHLQGRRRHGAGGDCRARDHAVLLLAGRRRCGGSARTRRRW